MNFTYLYKDDPDMDLLTGNITWVVPNVETPAHWIHAEYICKLNIFLLFFYQDDNVKFFFEEAFYHETTEPSGFVVFMFDNSFRIQYKPCCPIFQFHSRELKSCSMFLNFR